MQLLFTIVQPVEDIPLGILSWESNYGWVLLFALPARKLDIKFEMIPSSHVGIDGLDFCVLSPVLTNDS